MQSDKLPKMPVPWGFSGDRRYTPQQLQDYALSARKMALEEVRAELDYRYSSGGAAMKGSYEAGHATALDEMEGWVESLMEQDA